MSPMDKQRLKILKQQMSPEEQAILGGMVDDRATKDARAVTTWEERLAVLRKWHRLCKQSGLI